GLDPRFRELDDAQGAVLRSEAFRHALDDFCSGGDPDRLRLLATYGAAGLRRMLTGVFETLRSAGRELSLELGGRPELTERVEEFQDTNRLQCELVDLLRGPETVVFFVGDEFQAIYGFRHADVRVFRERRADAEQLLPLTLNYRSRAEVLAAVNELFGSHFGDEFQPLAAAAEFPDPVFGHPVELLVTDKPS